MKGETISGRYHYQYEYRPCVYKIENSVNGKVYIGSTKYPDQRILQHKRLGATWNLRNQDERSLPVTCLYKEMYEYGLDKFTFEILEEVPEISSRPEYGYNDILTDCEDRWLTFYIDQLGVSSVYNKSLRAYRTKELADEHRRAISEAAMGRRQSNDTKKNRGTRVIAINVYTNEAIIADTGKQLGDYFVFSGRNNGQAAGKDIIKNKLTKHQLLFGEWFLFYCDSEKMQREYDKIDNKGSYTKGNIYYETLRYLMNTPEEEWRSKYNIHDTSYDTLLTDLETRDGCYIIHSRNSRAQANNYNPTSSMLEKYGKTITKAFK